MDLRQSSRGRYRRHAEAIRDADAFSTINAENRDRTVAGVYVLVFSFIVQTIGAVLILADLILHPS